VKWKREILNDHSYFAGISGQYILDHRIKTAAKRALKIGEFNNGHRSIFVTENGRNARAMA